MSYLFNQKNLAQKLILVTAIICLFVAPSASCQPASIVTLNDAINLAEQNSDSFKAIAQSIKSLEAEIRSRDLELSAVISSEAAAVRDLRDRVNILNNDPNFPRGANGQYGLLDSSYTKPFDTGTQLSLGVGHNLWESSELEREDNLADWEVRVSQSLWRNSFGLATDLRRQSDQYEFNNRYLNSIAEKQRLTQQVEDAYWDLVFSRKEVAIRKVNLDRSIKLNNWMKERLSKFAAEETDRLQAETLLSERELDLSIAQDSELNACNRLKQLIPGVKPEEWKTDLKVIEQNRSLNSLILKSEYSQQKIEPELIDTIAIDNRVKQLETDSKRIEDSLNPDLSAYVSYGTTGSDNQFFNSWGNTADTDSNAARVGLLFTVQLDNDLINERISFARLSAESEQSRFQASRLQSTVGWKELTRNIESLHKQVKEARRLSDLQWQKVQAEKDRYLQGRSTTFQLISFELDASESELRLYRLLANLRKAENRARIYMQSL